jgi:hypothetical protein
MHTHVHALRIFARAHRRPPARAQEEYIRIRQRYGQETADGPAAIPITVRQVLDGAAYIGTRMWPADSTRIQYPGSLVMG